MKEKKLDKEIADVIEETKNFKEDLTKDTYIGVVVEIEHPTFKYGVIVNEDNTLEAPYLVKMYETLSIANSNRNLLFSANENEEWFKKEEINMFYFI